MSSEWETSSLLDHYDVRSGLSKPAKDFGSGFPFLTFKDVFYNYFAPERLGDLVQSTEKDRTACSVQRGDVFLTRTSETMHELGMSCVALKDYPDATFNGFCKRLRPKPDCRLVPEYVGYYLRSPAFRQAMLAMSTMSTRASLNNEMIGRLEISFPSGDIQVRIAAVLKSLDDRITLLRETNATLEAIAQALFKSWFVDFDPVHAKQQGRTPEGLDEATAALFPESFEESELGLVPKGWRAVTFGDVCAVTIGGLWGKDTNEDADLVPAVSLRGVDLENLRSLGFAIDAPVRWVKPAAMEKRRVSESEVLIASSGAGPCGRPLWAGANFESLYGMPVIFSNFVKRLECGNPSKAIFVDRLLAEMRASREIWNYINGTSIPNLDDKLLLATKKVVIPSDDVLAAFEKIARVIYSRLYSQQAQTLATLRDTLLPRLISGQLRLPEAEALIEEIA